MPRAFAAAFSSPSGSRPAVLTRPSVQSPVTTTSWPREQHVDRHVGELRVAVERLAVGERELRALDDRVDVLGARHRRELEAVEQRELLQEDRIDAIEAHDAAAARARMIEHVRNAGAVVVLRYEQRVS